MLKVYDHLDKKLYYVALIYESGNTTAHIFLPEDIKGVDSKGYKSFFHACLAIRKAVASGESKCSEKDQFVKRIGREIAMGRAFKKLGKKLLTYNKNNKRYTVIDNPNKVSLWTWTCKQHGFKQPQGQKCSRCKLEEEANVVLRTKS